MFGKVVFKNCEFFNSIPVLFESSYNAYTNFDLFFKKCIIHPTKWRNYLIYAGELRGKETDEREEIKVQKYPNLYVNGLTIDMKEGTDYYLYWFERGIIQWPIDTIPGIKQVKGLKFIPQKGRKLKVSNCQSLVRPPESSYMGSAFYGLVLICSITCTFKRKRTVKRKTSEDKK